jgi:hypothetical protein
LLSGDRGQGHFLHQRIFLCGMGGKRKRGSRLSVDSCFISPGSRGD